MSVGGAHRVDRCPRRHRLWVDVTRAVAFAALSIALAQVAQAQPSSFAAEVEVVVRLPQSVGNVTFAPDGAMIFSNHPFFEPAVRVARLGPSGTGSTPFPNTV